MGVRGCLSPLWKATVFVRTERGFEMRLSQLWLSQALGSPPDQQCSAGCRTWCWLLGWGLSALRVVSVLGCNSISVA